MLDGEVTDAIEARSVALNSNHIDIYSARYVLASSIADVSPITVMMLYGSSVGVRTTTVGQWTDLGVWQLGLSSRG